jgi:hypothetical protein
VPLLYRGPFSIEKVRELSAGVRRTTVVLIQEDGGTHVRVIRSTYRRIIFARRIR